MAAAGAWVVPESGQKYRLDRSLAIVRIEFQKHDAT